MLTGEAGRALGASSEACAPRTLRLCKAGDIADTPQIEWPGMWRLGSLTVLLVWMCAAAHGLQAVGANWGVRPDGQPVVRLASAGSHAVVLFFVATDCPISNRMFPEMKRLREEFASGGVRVWFVYPDEETADRVREHQRTFDGGGEAVLDVEGRLTQLAGVNVTPEIAVLAPDGRGGWVTAFQGRIDNRYVRLGSERPAATEHYGEEAIRAVLAGRPPRPDLGRPVGCTIYNPHGVVKGGFVHRITR